MVGGHSGIVTEPRPEYLEEVGGRPGTQEGLWATLRSDVARARGAGILPPGGIRRDKNPDCSPPSPLALGQ